MIWGVRGRFAVEMGMGVVVVLVAAAAAADGDVVSACLSSTMYFLTGVLWLWLWLCTCTCTGEACSLSLKTMGELANPRAPGVVGEPISAAAAAAADPLCGP